MNQEHLSGDSKHCEFCDAESPEDASWCIVCGARFPVEGPTQRLMPPQEFVTHNGTMLYPGIISASGRWETGASGLLWTDVSVGTMGPSGLTWEKARMGVRKEDLYAEHSGEE